MELIDIISSLIIYGSGLLILVVMISFVLSKTRTEEKPKISYKFAQPVHQTISPVRLIDIEQAISRKSQTESYPQIFRLDNVKPKEIKIIRKPTETRRESQEALRFDSKKQTKTDGNGIRYTIVNDDIKGKGFRAANFYL